MGFKSIWRSLTTGHHQTPLNAVPAVREDPLECVVKEQKRDEHLKNLGMKRNKSIRKSIVKKLRKKEKKDGTDGDDKDNWDSKDNKDNKDRSEQKPAPSHIETRTSIGSKIEGGTKVEVLTVVDRKEKELVGETLPLPGHIENEVPRKMDKLRRSLRHSMRKRKEAGVEMSRAQKWQLDEAGVRAGTCQYYVKYLGACEVFESRGMQVCEAAVSRLKTERRRTMRGTLYVSGDSIRLVDDDTKALIIDQTIEKVSFCAPDRNFEKGFSYISRDGTTRRWMCHAFMAVGDTGERLSHAVGCAFGICLENKQKRDKANVSVQYDSKESSFTRTGSFMVGPRPDKRQESFRSPVPPKLTDPELTKSVERPRPSDVMYQRQASFRGLGQISGQTPFKRNCKGNLSLRVNDLPSTRERRGGGLLSESPILEDIELPSSNFEDNSIRSVDLLTEDPFTQAELAAYSNASGTSTPALYAGDSSSTYSMSPPPSLLVPTVLHKLPETPEVEMNPWDNVPDQPSSPPSLPTSRPPQTNSAFTPNSLNSNLTKPCSINVNSNPLGQTTFNNIAFSADHWISAGEKTFDLDSKSPFINPGMGLDYPKQNSTSSGYDSPASTNSVASLPQSTDVWQHGLLESSMHSSILQDPFDAEWADIATRNYSQQLQNNNQQQQNYSQQQQNYREQQQNNNQQQQNYSQQQQNYREQLQNTSKNPFLQDSGLKAFELQL